MTMKKSRVGFCYKGSGLPDIWLINGYEIHDTPYGEGVVICNPERLHKTIACELVNKQAALNGVEFRFLRKEMDLSQFALAELLNVQELTVANYEKDAGKRGIPKTVDIILRAFYLEYVDKRSAITRMAKNIVQPGNHRAVNSFRFNRGRWLRK